MGKKESPGAAGVVRVGSETRELRRRLGLEPTAGVTELEAKGVRPRHLWQLFWRTYAQRVADRHDAELAASIPRFLRDKSVLDETGKMVRLSDSDRLDHRERHRNRASHCLRDTE